MRPRRYQLVLYGLLVVSALFALFGEPMIAPLTEGGRLGPWWLLVPPSVFLVFALAFIGDRLWMVRRRGYSPGRAFFQVALGLIFVALLAAPAVKAFSGSRKAPPRQVDVQRLLAHPQAQVRGAAAELLGRRGELEAAPALFDALLDDSRLVRLAAASAVRRLTGYRGPFDVDGHQGQRQAQVETWREWWGARSPTPEPTD